MVMFLEVNERTRLSRGKRNPACRVGQEAAEGIPEACDEAGGP